MDTDGHRVNGHHFYFILYQVQPGPAPLVPGQCEKRRVAFHEKEEVERMKNNGGGGARLVRFPNPLALGSLIDPINDENNARLTR